MSRVGWVVAAATALPFVVGSLVGPGSDAPEGEVAFTFTDPEVVESSGLVWAGGLAVTMNDSGDQARVFAVDPSSGDTVGTTTWGAEVSDLESLAPLDDGDVLVGDTGGNVVSRSSVDLYRVPVRRGATVAEVEPAEWAYPGGQEYDAEALLVEPGTDRFLVVTKGVFAGTVFQGSLDDGGGELVEVGPVIPMVTDGAFLPDGEHLVLRDYEGARVYSWPDLEVVAELPLPEQQQGEAIAVTDDGEVYVSSEGQYGDVLRVRLPREVRALVDGATDPPRTGRDDVDAAGGNLAGDDPPAQTYWDPWLIAGGAALGVVVLVRGIRRWRS